MGTLRPVEVGLGFPLKAGLGDHGGPQKTSLGLGQGP